MTPHAQWFAKLEQTLEALGFRTGYDHLEMAKKQDEWLREQEFIAAQQKKEEKCS